MDYKTILSFVLFLLFSCSSEVIYTPKPRGFPRIDFPERAYQEFEESYCNFTFAYPKYATIEQDTVFFDERPAHPCWFDIYVAQLNCRVHCSYYPINKENSFEKLNADAFKLTNKHVSKADYIDPQFVENRYGVSGFTFELDGPVATPLQFYLSDSTDHFLRAALYFNTQIRPDSLAPVFEFMKEDIRHMINTFQWKK